MLKSDGACVSEVTSAISRVRKEPSSSSSDDSIQPVTSSTPQLVEPKRSQFSSSCRLKKFASTPVLPYSGPIGFSHPLPHAEDSFHIPIVGYEVMEERARFTVYKLRIENRTYGDCWFVFRRYTDFVRLHSKLQQEFPKIKLCLPQKRWFVGNFSTKFIEARARGLQAFINEITNNQKLLGSSAVREFFCMDEPPSYIESGEESRAIFEALEETIYHLRKQLHDKDRELEVLRFGISERLQKSVLLTQRIIDDVAACSSCRSKVTSTAEELKDVLGSDFNSFS